VCGWVWALPDLSRITLSRPKRSLPQNDKMWAMLTELAEQKPVHCNLPMDPVKWKAVMMQALGAEMVMMPTLDGQNWFPLGLRSSDLDRQEMGDLIEFMTAWGAQNGVTFSHDT
jgi:hypothetical protein